MWRKMAKSAGIPIEEDPALAEQRKQAALARLNAELLGEG